MNLTKKILSTALVSLLMTSLTCEAGIFKKKETLKTNEAKVVSKMTEIKTFERPWGTYTVIDEGKGYLVKTITVKPDQKLSVQKHNYRAEHWIVLEGNAKVIKGNKELNLKTGDSIDIDIKEIHSLQNPYKAALKILEVQKGSIIDENDIERISDIYGRK